MSDFAMPPNLKLVLEHLNAVRELDRYLRDEDTEIEPGKGVLKDVERFVSQRLCPALRDLVPFAGWEVESKPDCANWVAESWHTRRAPTVAVSVMIPAPLGGFDEAPSVNLRVRPLRASKRLAQRSTRWVKKLLEDGFQHIDDNRDWDEEYPVAKYIPWLEPDDSFSEQGLLQRIAAEARKIVEIEAEIAESLRALQANSKQKTTRSKRTAARAAGRRRS